MIISIHDTPIRQKILRILQQERSGPFFNSTIPEPEHLPVPVQYKFLFSRGPIVQLWIVMDEHPEDAKGNVIVYDEEREQFGVASKSSNVKIDTGYFLYFCSSFQEATKKIRQ